MPIHAKPEFDSFVDMSSKARPDPDEAEGLLRQALVACGADDGIVYVMSTETRGPRELELMIELDADRETLAAEHRARRWERVIQPNAAETAIAVQRARSLWPHLLVPNLNGLDVAAWDPEHYRAFRERLTESYAVHFVAAPLWAWSTNERRSVPWARGRGIPIYGLGGQELSDETLAEHMAHVDEVAAMMLDDAGWSDERIARAVPQVI